MRLRIAVTALLALVLWAGGAAAYDAASGCVKCHGDLEQMKSLGGESMYLDPAAVDREVAMGGAPTCTDCHKGDAAALDKEAAHRGLLRPFVSAAGKKVKGEAVYRTDIGLAPLVPAKGSAMTAMIPKGDKELLQKNEIKKVLGLYYHDRDPKTFAYSPDIARDTCGKCHAKEVQDYNASSKGLMKHQRAYRSYQEELPGPQNCGAWFGNNYERLRDETSAPFTPGQNAAGDRSCNLCHAGCNDCHYKPFKGEGSHRFGKPETPSCYGGGRASICHAGPMDRRRGSGFMRGEYSFPATLPVEKHARKGVQCLDCHKPVDHKFGHLASDDARKSCRKCHTEIYDAVAGSPHSKVDCSSCHITDVGAYQFTFWGPGNTAGVETPYAKHKEYYGVRDFPTIIRNPAGLWIPVKPYPMAVLNQKGEVKPSGLLFRAIPKRDIKGNTAIGEPESFSVSRGFSDVNDAVIIKGTRSDLPSGNNAVLWVQIDKMSHALGKGRACKSCHGSKAQVSRSTYEYFDDKNVTEKFTGGYTVTADKNGIRFSDMKNSEIKPAKGRNVIDFAPFTFMPQAWDVTGIDLSIPFDERRYLATGSELDRFLKELEGHPQGDHRDRVRVLAYHNLKKAKEMLKKKR